MAHFSKDVYDAKREYASRRMLKNAENDSLTEEQHNALAWLCSIRHKMHTNQEAFFYSEYGDYSDFYDYIDYEINERLESVGLPTIKWHCSLEDVPCDVDFFELLPLAEQTEENHEEMLLQTLHEAEEYNKDIEKYLHMIDTTYGTDYCPTGASRIF